MANILLTKQQQEAVEHGEGPLLIIAGAGTGKTTVITERIRHLVFDKKIQPDEILALTFTEKAATEMEERIDKMMPYGYTQMWISTFHSFCDDILREEGINIGLNPGYRLMTEAENIFFLKKNLFNFELDYFRPLGNPTKFLEAFIQHFSRLKDEDITPEEYLRWAKNLNGTKDRHPSMALQPQSNEDKKKNKMDKSEGEELKKIQELAKAYIKYEELKVKEGLMDFTDLISNTLLLFRKRKNILKKYHDKFKFILVDEFQDTNYAQNELAILLAGDRKNITVVADDDQAIYRWRGAAISNVMQFKKNFPGTKIITLTQNFRSTQEILDKAYKLIQNNNPYRLEVMEQIDKKLQAERKTKAKKIELIKEQRIDEEAESIAKRIVKLVGKEGYSFKDIAILVRANNHAHPITSTLERYKIPYQFLGPGQLFHQEEIKDLIAYLKVIYDLSDSVSLFRVLSMDIFNLEGKELNYLLNFAKKKNLFLFEALSKTDEAFLKEETKQKLQKIYSMISKNIEESKKNTAGQILYNFLKESGIFKQLLEYKTQKEEKTAQNIAKFFDKLKSFEAQNEDAGVFAVVDWIDLMTQMGESPLAAELDWRDYNAVNILTIHSSKGLEFPVVFLVNLVQDRFPTRERKEKIPIPQQLIKEIVPEGDFHLQEERRLFYVGMTRAKDLLIFSASNFYGEGKRARKISPFVAETIPEIINEKEIINAVKQLSLIDLANEYEEKQESQIKLLPLKLNYISYSMIQAFEICPLHFKARYLLGIPTPPTHALSFGISMHSALKDFYEKFKEGENVNKDFLLNLLKIRWQSDGYLNKQHEEERLIKAREILKNYFENNFNPKTICLGVETPFSFYLTKDDGNPLKIAGKIDRIDKREDGKIEIIDYKTGKNDGTKSFSYKLQLGIYGLAANRVNHPLFSKKPEDIILTLFYIESGEKISSQLTTEELTSWEIEILNKVKEIENSDFRCNNNMLCGNCEYKMLCSQ